MKIDTTVEELEYFDFKSPYTGSNNIELRPIGYSYTYRKDNDNSDLKNAVLREGYNKVPYIGKLLLNISHKEILAVCKDTNVAFSINKPIQRIDMMAYLRRNDMEPVMRLDIKK